MQKSSTMNKIEFKFESFQQFASSNESEMIYAAAVLLPRQSDGFNVVIHFRLPIVSDLWCYKLVAVI